MLRATRSARRRQSPLLSNAPRYALRLSRAKPALLQCSALRAPPVAGKACSSPMLRATRSARRRQSLLLHLRQRAQDRESAFGWYVERGRIRHPIEVESTNLLSWQPLGDAEALSLRFAGLPDEEASIGEPEHEPIFPADQLEDVALQRAQLVRVVILEARPAFPAREPEPGDAPAGVAARGEPDLPVHRLGDGADVDQVAFAARFEDGRPRSVAEERIERIVGLPAVAPELQIARPVDGRACRQPAHPDAAVVGEEQSEEVAEHASRAAAARRAVAHPGMDVVRVIFLLDARDEGFLRGSEGVAEVLGLHASHAVIRRDVELAGMMEVIVDSVHDLARLVEVPVVRVVEIVAVDDERHVLLQEDLVHLAQFRDRVDVGVGAGILRLVRVMRVVADEGLSDGRRDRAPLAGDLRPWGRDALAARHEREVRRFGPAGPHVEPVGRRVAAEGPPARPPRVERPRPHHPQIFGLVRGRGGWPLVETLGGSVNGEVRKWPRPRAETAHLVRVGWWRRGDGSAGIWRRWYRRRIDRPTVGTGVGSRRSQRAGRANFRFAAGDPSSASDYCKHAGNQANAAAHVPSPTRSRERFSSIVRWTRGRGHAWRLARRVGLPTLCAWPSRTTRKRFRPPALPSLPTSSRDIPKWRERPPWAPPPRGREGPGRGPPLAGP